MVENKARYSHRINECPVSAGFDKAKQKLDTPNRGNWENLRLE